MSIASCIYKWFDKHKMTCLRNPVFIVGCGHSGTSIMLRIIGSHSAFCAIEDESRLFYKSNREMANTVQGWSKILSKNKKSRIVEKTPTHIYCLQDMFRKMQDAKIICMVRDGRDVACSHRHRVTFEAGLDNWVRSTLAIKPYMNHANLMVVKLEEFVANPTESLGYILAFIGEKFEAEMLDYHKTPAYHYDSSIRKPLSAEDGKNHRALRNWQINQPLFKTTSRWRLEMTEEEKELFKQKANNQLVFWGYEYNDQW